MKCSDTCVDPIDHVMILSFVAFCRSRIVLNVCCSHAIVGFPIHALTPDHLVIDKNKKYTTTE